MFRITHFRDKCIGCNACVEVAPDRWRMSLKDGKSVLINSKAKKGIYHALVSDDERSDNMIAASNCPVNIIRISDK